MRDEQCIACDQVIHDEPNPLMISVEAAEEGNRYHFCKSCVRLGRANLSVIHQERKVAVQIDGKIIESMYYNPWHL